MLSFREKLEKILNNSLDEKTLYKNNSNDLDRNLHKSILNTSIKLRKNYSYNKKNSLLTINNNNSFVQSKNYIKKKSLLGPKFEDLFTIKKFRNETNIPVLNTLFRSLTLKDIHNRIEKPIVKSIFTTIEFSNNNNNNKKKVYEIKDYISMNYNKNDYSINRPLSNFNQSIFNLHSKKLCESISPSSQRLKKYYKNKKKLSNYFIKSNIKKIDNFKYENKLNSRNYKNKFFFNDFTNRYNFNFNNKSFFNNSKQIFNGYKTNIL